MSSRWMRDRRRDTYYRKAKQEGYRSRAAYKLQQIERRFHLTKPGNKVVDLGCSPGGWTQVAVEAAGTGNVVGVDIARTAPVEGAIILQGDMLDPATFLAVRDALGGEADVVLSDMSPDISGHYDTDHFRSVELSEKALHFAQENLKPGGALIVKTFQGEMTPAFVDGVRKVFRAVKRHSPAASRKQSSEVYVVAWGFTGEREPVRVVDGDSQG